MSKSRHVCLKCGGTEFYTVAHIVQEWRVDADGDFIAVGSECLEVTADPDDGNIWECGTCGMEGELANTAFTSSAVSQCARFMAKNIGREYNNNSLNTKAVLETVDRIYGRELRNAVIACTLINNEGDGRIASKNAEWANQVKLPPNMSRIGIIGGDLTCHGCHIGLVDLLASEARR